MLTIGKGPGRDFKQRPRRSWAHIVREGMGQGFETETQEVLITYRKGGKGAGIWNRDSGGPEHLQQGRERGRFSKETQEVLSSIGSAYCLLKRLGKNLKQNTECSLLTTETHLTQCWLLGRDLKQRPRKSWSPICRKGGKGAGIWNRDSGGPEHLQQGRERGRD